MATSRISFLQILLVLLLFFLISFLTLTEINIVIQQCRLSGCILYEESPVLANLCPLELLLTPATHAPQIMSNAPQLFPLLSARNTICHSLLMSYSHDVFAFVTQFARLAG